MNDTECLWFTSLFNSWTILHQHGRLSTAVLCCGLEKNGMVGAWHGMASLNQTRPHCVNQMGKTHSKPWATWHGRGTAWPRHGHGMLCVNRPLFAQHEVQTGSWQENRSFADYIIRSVYIFYGQTVLSAGAGCSDTEVIYQCNITQVANKSPLLCLVTQWSLWDRQWVLCNVQLLALSRFQVSEVAARVGPPQLHY